MALTEYGGTDLQEHHPEGLTCVSTGSPSDVFWVFQGETALGLTADAALDTLPRLLADAISVKMGTPDNYRTKAEVLGRLLTQVETSLSSETRRWPSPSTLRVQFHHEDFDLLALARSAPVREYPDEAIALVTAWLSTEARLVIRHEERTANLYPGMQVRLPQISDWTLRRAAQHLLGILHREGLLDRHTEITSAEQAPLPPSAVQTLLDDLSRVGILLADLSRLEVVQADIDAASDILMRVSLNLLSEAARLRAERQR